MQLTSVSIEQLAAAKCEWELIIGRVQMWSRCLLDPRRPQSWELRRSVEEGVIRPEKERSLSSNRQDSLARNCPRKDKMVAPRQSAPPTEGRKRLEGLQWNQQEASACDGMIRKRVPDAAPPPSQPLSRVSAASLLRSNTHGTRANKPLAC